MPWSGTYSETPKALLDPSRGFREGGDFETGLFARVPYLVAWEDRFTFANEILGVSEWLGGTNWNRTPPAPYSPSPNMYAMGVEILGEGEERFSADLNDADYDNPVYSHAIVLVTYRTPTTTFSSYGGLGDHLPTTPEEQAAVLWAEQEIDWSIETVTVPRERLEWFPGGAESRVDSRLTIPIQTMTLIYHRLPIIPLRIVGGYMGKLNDREFFGCARGTVMCTPARTRRQYDTSGLGRQSATLTFRYRPVNWNLEYNPETGDWEKLVTKVGTRGRYAYANLLNLLNFIEFNAGSVTSPEDAILWG